MRALIPLLLLGALACSDSGGDAVDASPPDARILFDANRSACSADDDSCSELDFERVCDLDRGACVECVADQDCSGDESFGPTCRTSDGTCRCDSDDQCAGSRYGHRCLPEASACACIDADDCDADQECKLEPYLGTGVRRCRPKPAE